MDILTLGRMQQELQTCFPSLCWAIS